MRVMGLRVSVSYVGQVPGNAGVRPLLQQPVLQQLNCWSNGLLEYKLLDQNITAKLPTNILRCLPVWEFLPNRDA